MHSILSLSVMVAVMLLFCLFFYWLELKRMTSIHFKCNKTDFLRSLCSIFNFYSNLNRVDSPFFCCVSLFVLSSETHDTLTQREPERENTSTKWNNIKTSGVTHAKLKWKPVSHDAYSPSLSVFIEKTNRIEKTQVLQVSSIPLDFHSLKMSLYLKDASFFSVSLSFQKCITL